MDKPYIPSFVLASIADDLTNADNQSTALLVALVKYAAAMTTYQAAGQDLDAVDALLDALRGASFEAALAACRNAEESASAASCGCR